MFFGYICNGFLNENGIVQMLGEKCDFVLTSAYVYIIIVLYNKNQWIIFF